MGAKGGKAGKGVAKARDPQKARDAAFARRRKQQPDPAKAYEVAKPRDFGSLHERMKFAEDLARRVHDDPRLLEPLRNAVFDLAVEARLYHSDRSSRAAGRRKRKV